MKATVGNGRITLSDIETPDFVIEYLVAHGFDAVSHFSIANEGVVIQVLPLTKETEHVAE